VMGILISVLKCSYMSIEVLEPVRTVLTN
jgi:hypothetical protein